LVTQLTKQATSAQSLVEQIADPEIPAVTLHDLGIVRTVTQDGNSVVVELTPTYSGCPATEAIQQEVHDTLAKHGFGPIQVNVVLEPAWTTDRITAAGKQKLKQYGIAPPHCTPIAQNQTHTAPLIFFAPRAGVTCPRCDSVATEQIARFGSTPCKAQYRCLSCREPFDYFKPL
jgi:ring-1,2-phenylacetyl-CoA epoxidase subunit PaaD